MRHGSHIDPKNRFEKQSFEADLEHLAWDELADAPPRRSIDYLPDDSKSVVSENNSPDLPFRFSLNPYRGCAHGCAYCYARPYHEYLGMNAGLDFETKILVKHDAAKLFRDFLNDAKWQPQTIAFSGVTDCYQPAERDYQLTRQCIEVAAEAQQAISIVTKNALVVRDRDLLADMGKRGFAEVTISLTTLDDQLSREMEPRTSVPAARLRAIRALSDAGVPTRVFLAPVIPGLNDSEIPALLQAAADHGARAAAYILLRLPLTVEPVFLEWLARTQPAGRDRIESWIRDTRGGEMNDSQFGTRMRGTGTLAEQVGNMFRVFAKKHKLDQRLPPLDCSLFRAPRSSSGQQRLF